MEFTAAKSDLLKELNLTQGVIERKTTIPILSNLLLEVGKSQVQISATDLELGMRCSFFGKVKEEGSGTVPAKRLLEIVRSLPDAEIRFKLLENHWMQVTCGRSSFKLVGMARDNFPAIPAFPKPLVRLPAKVLVALIQRTLFAISNEESRYTLNGGLLLLKPEAVSMVATDGHRLALVECQLQVEGVKNELRVLIPKKAMGELLRLLAETGGDGEVQFSKDETHLFFAVGDPAGGGIGRLLISRMLTGQFPNYEAVLPRENKQILELDRGAITAAIRRVALLADERSRAIRLRLEKGSLEVFSSSGEFGEAHEILDTDYQNEKIEIGFNYQYLLDFLDVACAAGGEGRIRMELKDEQSAGQFRPVGDPAGAGYRYRYIVMPMRV